MTDPEAWGRLADAVLRRRVRLGLSQPQLAARAGLALATVNLLENAGRGAYRKATLLKLEQALGWPDGHVEAVLRGDAPVEPVPSVEPSYEVEARRPQDLQRLVVRRVRALGMPSVAHAERAGGVREGLLVAFAEGAAPELDDEDRAAMARALGVDVADVEAAEAVSRTVEPTTFASLPRRFGELSPQSQLAILAMVDRLLELEHGGADRPSPGRTIDA